MSIGEIAPTNKLSANDAIRQALTSECIEIPAGVQPDFLGSLVVADEVVMFDDLLGRDQLGFTD